MNGGWHSESAESVVVRLDGNVETVVLRRKKVIATEDGSCAWMAPTVTPIALSVALLLLDLLLLKAFDCLHQNVHLLYEYSDLSVCSEYRI